MKIQEIENLRSRWRELTTKSLIAENYDAAVVESELKEKIYILHRLNELGETNIEGNGIVGKLEETNTVLRKIGVAEPAS